MIPKSENRFSDKIMGTRKSMIPLNILHVFRATVGGLFRHVLDLTREQIARGHRVGLIADLRTGGTRADDTLRALEPSLALGLTRIPMRRHANPGDLFVLAHLDIVQFLEAYAAVYTCGAIAAVVLMIRGPIRLAHEGAALPEAR